MRITRRGDTLIEVILAIAVFSFVSVTTIILMSSGTGRLTGNLESIMARDEIEAQAEALRFIHNSYLIERELSNTGSDAAEQRTYENLWKYLSRDSGSSSASGTWGLANSPDSLISLTGYSCESLYDPTNLYSIFNNHAFILNTRNLDPDNIDQTIIRASHGGIANTGVFRTTSLYPRVIYSNSRVIGENSDTNMKEGEGSDFRNVASAEGIWIIAIREQTGANINTPQYYDFHIRACWYESGENTPSTTGTIIRLYNPEYTEATR